MTSLPQPLSNLSSKRRDGLVFVIGLLLLFSPVLVTMGFVGGTDYHYEGVEVVTTGDTLTYADESVVPDGTPISDEIACSGTLLQRGCALEPALADGETLPLGIESDNPNDDPAIADQPYEFVQLENAVYRTSYTTGEDNTVEVAINSTSPNIALHAVSVDSEEVSSTVVEAAEEGEATSRTSVDVPETPVHLDDGYYRVYVTQEADEGATSPLSLMIFFGAALGGILLLSLSRKLRVSYNPGR